MSDFMDNYTYIEKETYKKFYAESFALGVLLRCLECDQEFSDTISIQEVFKLVSSRLEQQGAEFRDIAGFDFRDKD